MTTQEQGMMLIFKAMEEKHRLEAEAFARETEERRELLLRAPQIINKMLGKTCLRPTLRLIQGGKK